MRVDNTKINMLTDDDLEVVSGGNGKSGSTCPECQGKAKTKDGKKCTRCNGTGIINAR